MNMNRWGPVFQLLGVGWFIAISLLAPFGIGLWLDKAKFNSFPKFTLIGIGLGTVVMIYGVYRIIRQVQAAEKERDKISQENKEQRQ